MKKILLLSIVTIIAFTNIGRAQTIDDFNFAGSLSANGWSAHSAGGTNPIATTTGLTFTNYINSGVGNAALVKNLGGEDLNYTAGIGPFSGNGTSVYFSLMVNVTEVANKSGDYFFHIGDRTNATSFTSFSARVFAKVNAGIVNFGISNTSTATYGATNFSANTTYTMIVKYTINTSGNDQTDLWVIPAGIPVSEALAGTPEVSNTTTTGQDIIDGIALRQGSATTSPQVVVDGIRIATSWTDLLAIPVATSASAITPTGFTANWNSASGVSGYYLDVATDAAFTNIIGGYNNLDVGNVTSKAIAGLSAGVIYYYRVRAYNGSGFTGPYSNIKANVELTLAGIEGLALSFTEGDAPILLTSSTTITANVPNLESAVIEITGNYQTGADVLAFTDANGITGNWNVGTGKLTLSGSSSIANYQAAFRSITYQNTSSNPSTAQRTISFTATGSLINSNTVNRNIAITGVNNAPILAGIEVANLTYTEGEAAKPITSSINVADVDNTTINSAIIQITSNYINGQDLLKFTNQNGITGVWTAGTGMLMLSGASTVANYQAALRSVSYQNTSQDPNTVVRTVSFVINDGLLNSNTLTRSINVISVNNRPEISAMENFQLSYTDEGTAVALTQTIVISDPDNLNLVSAQVKILRQYQNGIDFLSFTNANGITGTWDPATGTMSLSGVSSIANYQAALRSITYQFIGGASSNLYVRTVTFSVNDGSADSDLKIREVNLGNKAPILTGIESTPIEYKQGGNAQAIANNIIITNYGIPNIKYAIIQITGNYKEGEDILNFSNQNGIKGIWQAKTGVLELTFISSIANYQTALRSITYSNISNNPSPLPRTVSIKVADIYLESDEKTRVIKIIPIYTVSLNAVPSEGGTISGGGTFEPGASVKIKATPKVGYNFVNWTEAGTVVSTDAEYAFECNSSRTLTANFSIIQCVLSTASLPVEGGTTSGSGTFNYGKSVTILAVPNEGYSFVNWSSGSTIISTNAEYNFTITSNQNLVANFVKKYILTVNPTSLSVDAIAGTATINISNTGGGIMKWKAVSDIFWIKVIGEANGTNNGILKIRYDNNNSISRIGTITISVEGVENSETVIEIKQGASSASYKNLEMEIPTNYKVEQNYPNPFNPTTIIRYGLPAEGNVEITVYNAIGQEVAQLLNDFQSAGYHEINFDASKLPSGIYVYRISAGNFTELKKMILVK